MSTTLFRVVNQGLVSNSILVDKVDRSQGNFEGYARNAKQAVYVPLVNKRDTSVKGYIDMVPTDEVLLSMSGKGTLAELVLKGYVSVTAFASALKATSVLASAVHTAAGNVAGQTGVAATISAVAGGKATLTGLTGMAAGSTAHNITLSGCATAANNGTFAITDYISATSVKIANANAVFPDANSGAITWTEKTRAITTITGTTMASLSPDVTYVTLTNTLGASQTLTDQFIIAAGSPSSFSTTSIVIQESLLTIGTPGTGWKVFIKANSKLSNTVTM